VVIAGISLLMFGSTGCSPEPEQPQTVEGVSPPMKLAPEFVSRLRQEDDAFRLVHAEAKSILSRVYATGRGVERNEAVRLLRLAAEQGDAAAQELLVNVYAAEAFLGADHALVQLTPQKTGFDGRAGRQDGGADQDYVDALWWFFRAAKQDHNQDWTEAFWWFRRAAEQGHAVAQTVVGTMYRVGRGVAQDDSAAVNWFRRAAEQGDPGGQQLFSMMYEEGRGMTRDRAEAAKSYRPEAEQGYPFGRQMTGPMIYAETIERFNREVERGSRPERFTVRMPFAQIMMRLRVEEAVKNLPDLSRQQDDR